jgi:hypothetical protein
MSMSPSLAELLPKIKSLSYLFTDSEGTSVAHCLDLDLVATGENREVAERRLDNLVRAQIRTISERFNFADLNFSAPPDYWTKFWEGQEFKKARLELDVPPNFVLAVEQKVCVPVFMRAMPSAA